MPGRSSATVRVDGLRRLQRDLKRMAGDVADLKDANATAARIVAEAAASRAPRRSGRLAASLRGNRAAGKATVSAGSARLLYAGPVHWGWPAHHIAGNPFVVDAAQQTEHAWLPAYEQSIQTAAGRVAGTY